MEYLDNTGRQRLGDALKAAIGDDAKLSIIASYFTVLDWQPFPGHFSQGLSPAFLNSTGLI